jgi:hypothetical protein
MIYFRILIFIFLIFDTIFASVEKKIVVVQDRLFDRPLTDAMEWLNTLNKRVYTPGRNDNDYDSPVVFPYIPYKNVSCIIIKSPATIRNAAVNYCTSKFGPWVEWIPVFYYWGSIFFDYQIFAKQPIEYFAQIDPQKTGQIPIFVIQECDDQISYEDPHIIYNQIKSKGHTNVHIIEWNQLKANQTFLSLFVRSNYNEKIEEQWLHEQFPATKYRRSDSEGVKLFNDLLKREKIAMCWWKLLLLNSPTFIILGIILYYSSKKIIQIMR